MKCNFCNWSSKWVTELSFCPTCGMSEHLVNYNPMPVIQAKHLGME